MVSIKSLLSLITFFLKINQKVISWISFIGPWRIPLIVYKLSLALNAVEKIVELPLISDNIILKSIYFSRQF